MIILLWFDFVARSAALSVWSVWLEISNTRVTRRLLARRCGRASLESFRVHFDLPNDVERFDLPKDAFKFIVILNLLGNFDYIAVVPSRDDKAPIPIFVDP